MEWNKIKSLNPKTLEISTALLDTLYNFSTEEYLYRGISLSRVSNQKDITAVLKMKPPNEVAFVRLLFRTTSYRTITSMLHVRDCWKRPDS